MREFERIALEGAVGNDQWGLKTKKIKAVVLNADKK